MRRNRLVGVWWRVSLLLVAALLVAACGKKGDPVPSRTVAPERVSDLKVVLTGTGAALSWAVPGTGKTGVDLFKIFRHGESLETDCPGCPREFVPVADVGRNDPRYADGKSRMKFMDGDVKTGRVYRYRIVACTAGGICSAPSETAEIRNPGK